MVVEGGVLNHVKREGELSVHHENDVVSKSRYFSTVVIGWTVDSVHFCVTHADRCTRLVLTAEFYTILAERYYVMFGLWHEPSVCRLSSVCRLWRSCALLYCNVPISDGAHQ